MYRMCTLVDRESVCVTFLRLSDAKSIEKYEFKNTNGKIGFYEYRHIQIGYKPIIRLIQCIYTH